jgi:hypothetical protein
MNEGLKKLINAVGVLAEMMRLLREELLKNGFTRAEAIYLVGEFMKNQIKFNNNNNQEEN